MAEARTRMHEGFGWRAVIGVMATSYGGLSKTGPDLDRAVPEGVVFHRAHFRGPMSMSVEGLRALFPQIAEVARQVAFPGVDVILQNGIPMGIIDGIGTDKRIIGAVEEATGVKATTTATSIVEALRKLQITKIIIITGYLGEQVNSIFVKFMQDSGFDVLHHTERGQQRGGETPPHAYYRMAKTAFHNFPQAQGILLCPGGSSTGAEEVAALETDLRIPAVTQHSAGLWNVLSMAEVREPLEGWGRLLKLF